MFMDQCAVQVSALNFLIYWMRASILVWEDAYHREWNDVKAVARVLPKFWRAILHLKVCRVVPAVAMTFEGLWE